MKPHITCHMASSLDGRILPSRWRPKNLHAPEVYERVHEEMGCDAWLIGRVTGQEFAKGTVYGNAVGETFPRESWISAPKASAYAVVLDPLGKIAWDRSDIGGDPIVVVLTEQVSDTHLAGLRADKVSYIFAGEGQLDLRAAVEKLAIELGIKRILLEGGGHVNGSFLRAGLIDEVSLLIAPTIDGRAGAPAVFDSSPTETAFPPIESLSLERCELKEGGVVWLRYRLTNAG
jgi:riboflavin biosynthesis pyrimidine reductase